jgi:hypothetical protein
MIPIRMTTPDEFPRFHRLFTESVRQAQSTGLSERESFERCWLGLMEQFPSVAAGYTKWLHETADKLPTRN